MPKVETSEKISEIAQEAYANSYGRRGKEIHVSGTRFKEGPWYLSSKWNQFIQNWPKDKAVFVSTTPTPTLIGWLYFDEISQKWKAANNNGHDITGPFRSMETFTV
jgi:hypothetical protein